jgi:thiol-disulfide isomerase/thioredoxin
MKKFRHAVYSIIFAALASAAFSSVDIAAQDRQSVSDASLTIKDIRGRAQSPFKPDGQTASVLFFILQDCPISNRYAPEIVRIVSEYQPKKVRFYLVYIDPTVQTKEIEAHLREFNLPDISVIHDARRSLVAATGVSVTPEVAVVGKQGEILYRGRIDNLYEALGKPRRNVTERDLRNALDAVLLNRKVPVARTQAIGCYITAQN